jgi:hypothetical protein
MTTTERIQRLENAITYIEQHPEKHDQGLWIGLDMECRVSALGDTDDPDPWCGSKACLFGTIALQAGDLPWLYDSPSNSASDLWRNLDAGEDNTATVLPAGGTDPMPIFERVMSLIGFVSTTEASWWSNPVRTLEDFQQALEDMKAGRRPFWHEHVYGADDLPAHPCPAS